MAKFRTNSIDDDQDITTSDEIFVSAIARRIEIFLSGPIKTQENYTKHYQLIRNAGPNDEIYIYINSGGGAVSSALQFIRAMQETQARIVCSAEGECMSAATMIFLYGDTLEVSQNCLFLFHNYSGGSFGKGGEMYDNIIFEREWSKKLLHEIYDGFFSGAEIESMLHNKDIWMHADEVLERAQKCMEYRAALAKQEQEAEDEDDSQLV